jgi:hypothetical protein
LCDEQSQLVPQAEPLAQILDRVNPYMKLGLTKLELKTLKVIDEKLKNCRNPYLDPSHEL